MKDNERNFEINQNEFFDQEFTTESPYYIDMEELLDNYTRGLIHLSETLGNDVYSQSREDHA